jgi:hypothetical protein
VFGSSGERRLILSVPTTGVSLIRALTDCMYRQRQMAEVEALFEKKVGEVLFFDPATNPLGDPGLTVR